MSKIKHWDWSNFWPGLVVGIIILILGGIKLSDKGTNQGGNSLKNDSNVRVYSVQKKVSSPISEISVYDLKCGTTKYDDYYVAKGEFCVASVYVVNRDNTTQDLIPYNWKLYAGEQGFTETSYVGTAFEDILPGQSGTGTIAFDITKGVVPNSIVVFGAETLSKAIAISF